MSIERREFLQQLALAMGGIALLGTTGMASADEVKEKPVHDMSSMPASWMGKEQIAMLMYPGFTAQDLVGPQYMFANLMGAKVCLVAQSREPVMSDTGLAIVPTHTFDDCPRDLDILFIPGGSSGTLEAMENKVLIDFVMDRGSRAKWISSVCTGSLVLGVAGLLQGYRATSHWVMRDLLKNVGAIPVDARVVQDRNRITGAGVTAGLDFGLTFIAKLRDQNYAETVQLLAEYAPEPPFNAGTPKTAPAGAIKMMDEMFAGFIDRTNVIMQKAAVKLQGVKL